MNTEITPDTDPERLANRLTGGPDPESLRSSEARRRLLERWADVLTNENLSIDFTDESGKTAHVTLGGSHREIVIPSWEVDQPLTDLDREVFDLLIQRTLTLHEVGHVLFTDGDALARAKEDIPAPEHEMFHMLFNALEDGAIEEQLRQEYDVAGDIELTNANFRYQYDNNGVRVYDLIQATRTACLNLAVHDSGHLSELLHESDNSARFTDDSIRNIFESEILQKLKSTVSDTLTEPDPDERTDRILELWKRIREHFTDYDLPDDIPDPETELDPKEVGDGSEASGLSQTDGSAIDGHTSDVISGNADSPTPATDDSVEGSSIDDPAGGSEPSEESSDSEAKIESDNGNPDTSGEHDNSKSGSELSTESDNTGQTDNSAKNKDEDNGDGSNQTSGNASETTESNEIHGIERESSEEGEGDDTKKEQGKPDEPKTADEGTEKGDIRDDSEPPKEEPNQGRGPNESSDSEDDDTRSGREGENDTKENSTKEESITDQSGAEDSENSNRTGQISPSSESNSNSFSESEDDSRSPQEKAGTGESKGELDSTETDSGGPQSGEGRLNLPDEDTPEPGENRSEQSESGNTRDTTEEDSTDESSDEKATEEEIERWYGELVDQQRRQEESDRKKYSDAIEEYADVLDELERMGIGPNSLDVADGSNRRQAEWTTIRRESNQLRRILEQRLQQERRSKRKRGRRTGHLDSRSLSRVVRDDPRVFQQEDDPDEKDYRFIFVLDRSGSMGSEIEVAERALVTLSNALEEIDIEVSIIDMYQSEARLAKPFGVDTENALDRLLTGETGGSTPLSDVLRVARERVEGSEENPAMIVVTDGSPNNKNRYLDELQQTHFPVVGVYIALNAQSRARASKRFDHSQQLYDRRKIVIDQNEIANDLRGLCREIMF